MERPTKMTPRLILIMLKHHPMCYVIECTMNLNRCDKATAEALVARTVFPSRTIH